MCSDVWDMVCGFFVVSIGLILILAFAWVVGIIGEKFGISK